MSPTTMWIIAGGIVLVAIGIGWYMYHNHNTNSSNVSSSNINSDHKSNKYHGGHKHNPHTSHSKHKTYEHRCPQNWDKIILGNGVYGCKSKTGEFATFNESITHHELDMWAADRKSKNSSGNYSF